MFLATFLWDFVCFFETFLCLTGFASSVFAGSAVVLAVALAVSAGAPVVAGAASAANEAEAKNQARNVDHHEGAAPSRPISGVWRTPPQGARLFCFPFTAS